MPHRRLLFFAFVIILVLISLTIFPGSAQETILSGTSPDAYTRASRLGITHINSAEIPADDSRYQKALELGTGWSRYPIYWQRVEKEQGTFTWEDYDRVVAGDIEHGINTAAILMGLPPFFADAETEISGLNEPIFTDGSDIARANKTINPENPWAMYVFQTVQRYKPGGEFAVSQGWDENQGIRVWEVWNEPDFEQFWKGTWREYARLIKVAYLAAHHADPSAVVMMGGLLYNTQENWLARVLSIYGTDLQAQRNNYFMDAVAVHSYGYPWRSGWLVVVVRETLEAYKLRRPIWLNETGIPLWDDYPGPVWADNAERSRMATADQQAWFLIQSAAYAWAEGADKIFYHQLYDDCGDQPPGTNFSPHNGELCTGDSVCSGSAFGLYRNETTSVCYNQHPFPGTARPAAQAYRLLADVFGDSDFGRGEIERINGATIIHFERPSLSERIHVAWNRAFEPNTYTLPATGVAARLYTLEGAEDISPNDEGNYVVDLKAALPDNYSPLETGDISAIGGAPVILVERFEEGAFPPLRTETLQIVAASGIPTGVPEVTPLSPLDLLTPAPILVTPQPGMPTFTPPAPPLRPTISPGDDISPPVTQVEPLPEVSPAVFEVRWSATDDSGIDRFLVWVKVNDGEWIPWLETARTESFYTGESGSTYSFAAWAVDLAGNWSANVNPVAQATTRVE